MDSYASSDKKKTAVIGLDGANLNIIEKLGIGQQAVDCLSTIPPYTPPAWTSIISGSKPNTHGVFGFFKIDSITNHIRLTNSKDIQVPRLFDLLGSKGYHSIIANLPLTYPYSSLKYPKNTIIIPDWASPLQEIHPMKIHQKYKDRLSTPPNEWSRSMEDVMYLKEVEMYLTQRCDLYLELLDNYEWDFFFGVLSEIDWILHRFPEVLDGNISDGVSSIFSEIKIFIGEVADRCDILFLISDHGFERKHTKIAVNSLLKRNKLAANKEWMFKIVRMGNYFLKSTGLTRTFRKHAPKFGLPISASEIESDIFANDAFMFHPANWGVYINNPKQKGRIIELFENTKGIEMVVPSEYLGSRRHPATPDLFLIPKKGFHFIKEFKDDIYIADEGADHETHGIFAASGAGIKDHYIFKKSPTVIDLTPTILYIYGIKQPVTVEGRVLSEIFTKGGHFDLPLTNNNVQGKKKDLLLREKTENIMRRLHEKNKTSDGRKLGSTHYP